MHLPSAELRRGSRGAVDVGPASGSRPCARVGLTGLVALLLVGACAPEEGAAAGHTHDPSHDHGSHGSTHDAPRPEGDAPGRAPTTSPLTLPFPLELDARFELAVGGRPEGVVVTDLDEDGRAEVLVTHRAGARPPALVVLDGALRELTRHPVGDWPLAPSVVRTPEGARVIVASRSTREVVSLDPFAPHASSVELEGVPHLMATGPLSSPSRDSIAVLDRSGTLVLLEVEGNDGLRKEQGWDLGLDAATLLAIEPNMFVVGSMAQGSEPDRLQRWTLARGTEPRAGASEPMPGIPRAWLVTPRGEWVCAGDDALLRHDGTGWVPQVPLGRVPLRLAGLGGEQLLALTRDLTVHLQDAEGARRTWYAGQDAWGMDAGDLDGDGSPDLVIANRNAERVSLLRGGGGTWRGGRRIPVADGPIALTPLPDGRLAAVSALTDAVELVDPSTGSVTARWDSLGRSVDRAVAMDLEADGAPELVLRAGGTLRIVQDLDPGRVTSLEVGATSGALVPLPSGLLVLDEASSRGRRIGADGSGGFRVEEDAPLPGPALAGALHEGRAVAVLAGPTLVDLGTGALLAAGAPWTCSDPRLAGTSVPLDACVVSSDLGPLLAVLLRDDRAPEPPGRVALFRRDGQGWELVETAPTGLRPFAIAAADPLGGGTEVLAVSCQNSHHVNLWSLGTRAAGAGGPERTVVLQRAVDLGAGRGPLDLVPLARPDGSSWLAVGANFSNELLLYGPR